MPRIAVCQTWRWVSTKPGTISRRRASITSASASIPGPIAAIRPSSISRSAPASSPRPGSPIRTSPPRSSVRAIPRRVEVVAMPRLRRVDCSSTGIRRVGRGRGFSYEEADGTTIRDREVVERIRELAIPPAWKDVWICPHPNGHIQATGIDDAGRKQYLYHPQWREDRDREKFDRDGAVRAFASAHARADRHGPGPSRAGARAGARLRRAPARPRLLSDRQRALHRGERDLRAGDPAASPRDHRQGRCELSLHGQGRQGPPPGDRRPGARADAEEAARPRRRRLRAARLPQRSQRLARREGGARSTTT